MKTVEWKKREELCSLFVQYHKMFNYELCKKYGCGYFHCKPPETVAPKKAVHVRSKYERVNNRASLSHRLGIIPNGLGSSPASSSSTINENILLHCGGDGKQRGQATTTSKSSADIILNNNRNRNRINVMSDELSPFPPAAPAKDVDSTLTLYDRSSSSASSPEYNQPNNSASTKNHANSSAGWMNLRQLKSDQIK